MRGKKESFVYLGTKILTGLIGIISVGVQTRLISPEANGDFSLIIGFTGVLVSVLASWLGSSGLRYYNQYCKAQKEDELLSTIMIDWLIMLAVMILVALLGSCFIRSVPIKDYLPYVILIVFWSSLWEIYEKIMRASKHNILYCVILLFQSIINILVIVVYHRITGKEIESLFVAKILVVVVAILIILITLRVFKHIKIKSYSWKTNLMFFKYGFPMVGVWGVSWLLNYSDRYIINHFLNNTQVGLYDVAYRFSESSLGMIISAFNLAFFPAMIRTWNENGKKETVNMMKHIFTYYFMFAIPALIGITMLSSQFYGTILDDKYKEASVVMAITGFGFVFMGINNTLYKLWQLEEKTHIVLYLTIISVVLNITTNIIFIPLYGYIAAAVTTVASYFFTTILIIFLLRKKFEIKFDFVAIMKQFISGLVMSIFIFFAKNCITSTLSLLLVILFSCLIYFLSLTILGGTKNELNSILRMLGRKNNG